MSSEPYVPSEEEMREYVVVGGEYRPWAPPGDGTETARGAAFDRFIAKVQADALREAARDMRAQVERATEHQRFTEHELVESGVEHVLNEYADRIEQEARDGE